MFSRLQGALRELEPRSALTTADTIRFIAWPLAVMTILHRVLILAVNGHITDDFRPVYNASLNFLNHRPVYTEDFTSVDPHYLYQPSGTLLIAPLAILDPERARWLFIGVNAIAIILAWYLLLRLFGFGVKSVIAPVTLFAMFVTETVTNTLVFANVNGCVLLGEVAFLLLLFARRDLWAGAALGLTIAVKPVLAPLLLVAAARRQWKVFITAIAVPAALMGLAWPLSADPMNFVRRTLPYLFQSRDYFNSALVGNAGYYGVAPALTWGIRLLFAAIVLASLWLLYRYHRDDEVFFVVTATGVLLTASYLLGSLGQMYYSMVLFPLVLSVVLPNSVMRNWPAWLAIYLCMSADKWLSGRFVGEGRLAEYIRGTLGWSLLLLVVFAVLGDRYLARRRKAQAQPAPINTAPAVPASSTVEV